jgi:cell division septum initiation protein DivIVA
MKTNDQALLQAALIGYQHQAEELAQKIAELRHQLSGKPAAAAPKASASAAAAPAKKRTMSSAARKRIAAAQKKRWAEYHKQKEGKA